MSTIDSRSIALADEGCAAELTEEDKALILRLVTLEFSKDKSESSGYKCKQKCSVCSEDKPHFPVDESLLQKLLVERKVFLSIEDREAIDKDLVHEYFKQKWEVRNQKMKTLQPKATKTDSDLSKCTKRNSTNETFSNNDWNTSSLHDDPKPSDFKQMSYEVETTTVKKTSTEIEQIENEYIKIMNQEEVSRYKEMRAEKKSAQIHCDQSTREQSHVSTRLEGTRTENAQGQRELILMTRKEEAKECKNKPKITTQKDKHDERTERLKRMKASWEMAVTTWNRSKSNGSHSNTATESKSHENAKKTKGDSDDKRDGSLVELLAEISRMETQAPFQKKVQIETSRKETQAPSITVLQAETSRRNTQAPSKKELQAETSRRETQAPSKKGKDKNDQEKTDPPSTALFNGKPMDDPKGKYYLDRESVDVEMYQEGLKYDKWNPTQCLYEITSKCGWTWPLFTVTRVDKTSLIPSYVCEAMINGENFKTDEGVAQKKFAQHMASTKILKYIGFDFEYHCTKI